MFDQISYIARFLNQFHTILYTKFFLRLYTYILVNGFNERKLKHATRLLKL